jgi:hypothetical protein
MLVVVFNNFSTGPVAYMHISEVAVDAQLSVTLVILTSSLVFFNLITTPLLVTKGFGQIGVFSLYALLCFSGSFLIWYFMKHSEGLRDIEKKTLYFPEDERNRILREEEESRS